MQLPWLSDTFNSPSMIKCVPWHFGDPDYDDARRVHVRAPTHTQSPALWAQSVLAIDALLKKISIDLLTTDSIDRY